MAVNGLGQPEYFRGTIKSYNQTAGFGSLEPDENQGFNKLLLVHSRAFRRPGDSIEPGDRVLFMTREVPTGLLATDVHAEAIDEEFATTTDEFIQGIVKDYNSTRGFGFIKLSDNREAFFHKSYVIDPAANVLNGMPVTCSLVQTERGLQAQNVSIQKAFLTRHSGTDYLPQAMLARDSRRYDEAAALYENGLRESPSVQLILSYAAMEKNGNRNSNARRIYETGIRLFPDVAKLREDAGVLAASQRDYRTAIVRLGEAPRDLPQNRSRW